MNNGKNYITYFINFIVFTALEVLAVTMVANGSIIQRSRIMETVSAVTNTLAGTSWQITRYFSLGEVNRKLAAENTALRMENDRLKAALDRESIPDSLLSDDPVFEYIPAAVVSNSTDRLHNYLIINKGRRDGIREDMGVITGNGIIGYIQSAGEKYSKVSSLLDTDNMASAVLKSSNTFGVLKWNGESVRKIILHDIPVHTWIPDGDTVVSSGYSLIYPAGIPVGTVTSMELQDGINYDITVTMFEDFQRLRHVYVAVRKDIEELEMLKGEISDTEKQ